MEKPINKKIKCTSKPTTQWKSPHKCTQIACCKYSRQPAVSTASATQNNAQERKHLSVGGAPAPPPTALRLTLSDSLWGTVWDMFTVLLECFNVNVVFGIGFLVETKTLVLNRNYLVFNRLD